MLKSTRPFSPAAAAASLAGLLFCLWVFFTGGKALCLTDGCALFQDFRLAGVSLWQAGIVLFSVLLALALLRFSRAAYLLAALALAADAVLLCVMVFTSHCLTCLLVGALIALNYLILRADNLPPRRERSTLAAVWLVLLVIDLGGVARDLADPWSPLPAPEQGSSVQVYFSPSCRACQTLIANSDRLADAAWYPVPEDARDVLIIADMADRLEKGESLEQAVQNARRNAPDPAAFEQSVASRLSLLKPSMLLLQFRLWRNHAHVLAAGSDRLPFVEFKGLPAFLAEEPTPEEPQERAPAAPPSDALPDIPGLGVAGFCGGGDDAPCEEPPSPPSSSGLIDTSGMTP